MRSEEKVLGALVALGGEGKPLDILHWLRKAGGYKETFWGMMRGPSLGMVYASLDRLEMRGTVTSRLGEATAARGWRPSRIYTVASVPGE